MECLFFNNLIIFIRLIKLTVSYCKTWNAIKSHVVWDGVLTYTPEIIRNSSTGENPVCPKPVSRTVVSHMGESERIAVKFVASEYTGRIIEPWSTVLIYVRRWCTFIQKAVSIRTNNGHPYWGIGVREYGMYIKGGSWKMGDPSTSSTD